MHASEELQDQVAVPYLPLGTVALLDVEGLGSYPARYVRHPPIGESRILGFDDGGVRIRYEWDNEVHETTVATEDFVGSLLSNIPPKGFRVVRWYGLYSPTLRRWARWRMCGIDTVLTRLESYIDILSGDEMRCAGCGGVMEPMVLEYVRNGRGEVMKSTWISITRPPAGTFLAKLNGISSPVLERRAE